MKASEIGDMAREKLISNWGKAALLTFFYTIITYAVSYILKKFSMTIGPIISFIITVPLSYGFIVSLINLNDDQDIGYFDFFEIGFSNFTKLWSTIFYILLKLLVPITVMVICMFLLIYVQATSHLEYASIISLIFLITSIYLAVKTFTYRPALFILHDNPELTSKDIVDKSEELMKGNVWSLICLNLSFIGWAILGVFTLGIGFFWLVPYIRIAEINFYRNLTGETVSEKVEEA